jgi:hypothetical protein
VNAGVSLLALSFSGDFLFEFPMVAVVEDSSATVQRFVSAGSVGPIPASPFQVLRAGPYCLAHGIVSTSTPHSHLQQQWKGVTVTECAQICGPCGYFCIGGGKVSGVSCCVRCSIYFALMNRAYLSGKGQHWCNTTLRAILPPTLTERCNVLYTVPWHVVYLRPAIAQ